MASISRLARALNSSRTIAKTLNTHRLSPSPPRIPRPLPLYINRYLEQNKQTVGSCGSKTTRELTVPTILPGLHGFGLVDLANAYSTKAAADNPTSTESGSIPPLSDSAKTMLPTESSPTSRLFFLEETARRDELRLESLLWSKGVRHGSCCGFTVVVKGQKLAIKVKVPPSCATADLISTLESRFSTHRDLCICVFCPYFFGKAEIEFMKVKEGSFTSEELDAVATAVQIAGQQPRGLVGMLRKWSFIKMLLMQWIFSRDARH